MESTQYIKFFVVILVLVVLGGIGGVAYDKYADKHTLASNGNTEAKTLTSSTGDVMGKVVNINTNAEKATFIKVKDNTDSQDYSLYTKLDPKSLGVNLGDTIKFSKTLETNAKKTFFVAKNLTDYQIIAKNTNEISNEAKQVSLADVNNGMQGTQIVTSGLVKDLSTKSGHTFFTIVDGEARLKAVLFKAESNEMQARLNLLNSSMNANQKLNFVGKVDIYKGETEIILSKIYK